jgi:2-polyprenyl-6-methoxyphenol hydroxylase-like FAD-dependent oxidoreductase
METDVLIVGAGPTGLALATQLARYDIDFVIVDKNRTTTPHSKAIGVQARTLEIYHQIGLADRLIALGSEAERVRLVEGGEVRGEIVLRDIGRGMSEFPFLLLVEQGLHEKLLYDHIVAGGHDVRWQTELTYFQQDTDSVRAEVTTSEGEMSRITAKYLVGCDGAKSLVRHTLGIPFAGSTFERLFYVADVELEWKLPHDGLVANLGRNTLAAIFPMKGERNYRIVGSFPEGHEAEEGEILYEEIEQQFAKDTDLAIDITRVNWFSSYKVHSRAVDKFSVGRCFLAGDSAHIHTPAGAQGMNTGIQDGYNLAWKLWMVLDGRADEKLLETYNEERLPNARRLVQTTDRFFQFAASDEWFISFFRVHVFPRIAHFAFNLDAIKRVVFPLVSQIGINYRESSLSAGGRGLDVQPGDRMPYFEIEGESVHKYLREPAFHVIHFLDGTVPENEAAAGHSALGDSVVEHSFPLYPHIAELFGTAKAFSVLIRPDGHIAAFATTREDDGIVDYMRRFTKK